MCFRTMKAETGLETDSRLTLEEVSLHLPVTKSLYPTFHCVSAVNTFHNQGV